MAIYKKLLELQKQEIAVTKTGKNPHFKSSYATLNEVLEKVKKPLNDLGILIVQKPQADGLLTRLIDTEDESETECFVPFVNTPDMQKLGGAITYARRYSLVTLLGLEDEDDDGNKASEAPYMSKPIVKPTIKPDPFKAAKAGIEKCETIDQLNVLSTKIAQGKLLTDDQKEELALLAHDRMGELSDIAFEKL